MTPDLSARLQAACRLNSVIPGVWESLPDYGSMLERAGEGWSFGVSQIEGPGQYDRVIQSVAGFRFSYPNMPWAVVTNFGGLGTNALAQPLINAGLRCIVECFIDPTTGNPNATPENQVAYAKDVLGWSRPQPMLGLGSGLTLDQFPDYQRWFGYSIWSAEYLL